MAALSLVGRKECLPWSGDASHASLNRHRTPLVEERVSTLRQLQLKETNLYAKHLLDQEPKIPKHHSLLQLWKDRSDPVSQSVTFSGGAGMAPIDERYWRVRMNYGGYEELSRQAWGRNGVGVWYGGWSAKDYDVAQSRDNALDSLNSVPGQRRLGWKGSKSFLDTCRRFAGISEADWVVIF